MMMYSLHTACTSTQYPFVYKFFSGKFEISPKKGWQRLESFRRVRNTIFQSFSTWFVSNQPRFWPIYLLWIIVAELFLASSWKGHKSLQRVRKPQVFAFHAISVRFHPEIWHFRKKFWFFYFIFIFFCSFCWRRIPLKFLEKTNKSMETYGNGVKCSHQGFSHTLERLETLSRRFQQHFSDN